jgi:hypothetical protein
MTRYIDVFKCNDGVDMVRVLLGYRHVLVSFGRDLEGHKGVVCRELKEPIPAGESLSGTDPRLGKSAVFIQCDVLESALCLQKQVNRLVEELMHPKQPELQEGA